MSGRHSPVLAVACVFALLTGSASLAVVTGCSSTSAGPPNTPTTADAPKAGGGAPEWVLSQAAAVTGKANLDLVQMDGASEWLGGNGVAAFRDRSDGTEFIADLAAERLIAFTPADGVDGSTAKEPKAYRGEPGREAILRRAEAWAAKKAPGYPFGGMRRTVTRRVFAVEDRGDVLGYHVTYQKYVRGVRVREFASLSVELPTWDWKPKFYLNKHLTKDDSPPEPAVEMRAAIQSARQTAGMSAAVASSAELLVWGRGLEWLVILDRGEPAPGAFGGGKVAVNVNATTGEVRSTASSKTVTTPQ